MRKLLYMCQERADIMYSVKEKAKQILCPAGSDEVNMKRIARYLKGVWSAKCLIKIKTFPQFVKVHTDCDKAGQYLTCKSTSGGVTQWRSEARLSLCMFKNTTVSELDFGRSRSVRPDNWNCRRMVTKHLLKELVHEVTLVNHVDSQSAKAWASKRGLGSETCNVEVHVRERCRGEEANDTCLCQLRIRTRQT